jgi:hypothetical protein
MSDVDYLSTLGYIEKRKSLDSYALSERLLRQEVVALAVKISNIYTPVDYVCRGVFIDITPKKPNSWACRVIE